MAPVVVFRVSPAGKAGLTENDVAVPPPTVALLVAMATPGQ